MSYRSRLITPLGLILAVFLLLTGFIINNRVFAQTVIATIPVGDAPSDIAVNSVTNRVYVSNTVNNNISVIDGASNTVVTTIPSPVSGQTRSVTVNAVTNRIYVGVLGSNKVLVIDGVNNSIINVISVGGSPSALAVNVATNRVYASLDSANSVAVIDGFSDIVIATIPVGSAPIDVAINTNTNRIYTANIASNTISVIDGTNNIVVANITNPAGSGPIGVAVNNTTNSIYVTNDNSSNVSVIDGSNNTVIDTITVGTFPRGVEVNPANNRVYVANVGSETVSVIDGGSNTVVSTVNLGLFGADDPVNIAVNATISRIYVVNISSDNVSVLEDFTNQPPIVDAGSPYYVDEGGSVQVTATGSDPENGPLTYAWDLDNNGSFETPGQTVTFSATGLDGPSSYTIAVQVTDDGNLTTNDQATVNVLNVAPIVGIISVPVDPVQVNTSVNISANFTDPGVLDTHTALWNWGNGTTSNGTVTESNGSGTISDNRTYTVAGVYTITLTVTDKDGGIGSSTFQYVVVYDPSAGFVTGGGILTSPTGAYTANLSLIGKAIFGFVSKYQKGANLPTGNTEFQFKVANFNFHSTSYDWLVVGGARAQYKGSGTINGSGDYAFILTAIDGQKPVGGGIDKFRIKITDKGTGNVIYDNQIGASDTTDPTTAIDSGSITIHN